MLLLLLSWLTSHVRACLADAFVWFFFVYCSRFLRRSSREG
jgi:hypothetical protein